MRSFERGTSRRDFFQFWVTMKSDIEQCVCAKIINSYKDKNLNSIIVSWNYKSFRPRLSISCISILKSQQSTFLTNVKFVNQRILRLNSETNVRSGWVKKCLRMYALIMDLCSQPQSANPAHTLSNFSAAFFGFLLLLPVISSGCQSHQPLSFKWKKVKQWPHFFAEKKERYWKTSRQNHRFTREIHHFLAEDMKVWQ